MCAFKTLNPIEVQISLVYQAIVCLSAEGHGPEPREGLRGLCWGWGCLSDCLRTKNLLWLVIKALGNNRHNIHLDKYTFTGGCVSLNACSLALICRCMHTNTYKIPRNPFLKTFPTIMDETVLKCPVVTGKGFTVLRYLRCSLWDVQLCWMNWEDILWLNLPRTGRSRPIVIQTSNSGWEGRPKSKDK